MLNQAATLNDTHRWRSLVLTQSFRLTDSAGSSYANSLQGSSVVLRTCAVAAHFGATYSYAVIGLRSARPARRPKPSKHCMQHTQPVSKTAKPRQSGD
eukprot:3376782-Heterocapsa_arctica.AAC.1